MVTWRRDGRFRSLELPTINFLAHYLDEKRNTLENLWTHRHPGCQPMAMELMVLHDDEKAAEFDRILELFGYEP